MDVKSGMLSILHVVRMTPSFRQTLQVFLRYDGAIGMFLVEYPRLTGSILIRRVLNSKGAKWHLKDRLIAM